MRPGAITPGNVFAFAVLQLVVVGFNEAGGDHPRKRGGLRAHGDGGAASMRPGAITPGNAGHQRGRGRHQRASMRPGAITPGNNAFASIEDQPAKLQ